MQALWSARKPQEEGQRTGREKNFLGQDSRQLIDSGPWKCTRAVAGKRLQGKPLSASLYSAQVWGQAALG